MQPSRTTIATLDLVARAQLALIHAAIASPYFDWNGVQQLVQLWRKTNAQRYQHAGVLPEDVQLNLRMVFRDYIHEVRQENAEEAERIQMALGMELEM